MTNILSPLKSEINQLIDTYFGIQSATDTLEDIKKDIADAIDQMEKEILTTASTPDDITRYLVPDMPGMDEIMKKLYSSAPGDFIRLTPDEMALILEIRPWPLRTV